MADLGAQTNFAGDFNSQLPKSADKVNQSYMAGTDAGKSLLGHDSGFDKSLSYDSSPMSGAIQQRAQRGYQLSNKRLGLESKMASQNDYFDKLATASKLSAQEAQLNHQRRMAKMAAKKAKQQARGQLLGTVLGIGAAIATGGLAAGALGGVGSAAGIGFMGGNAIGNALGGG